MIHVSEILHSLISYYFVASLGASSPAHTMHQHPFFRPGGSSFFPPMVNPMYMREMRHHVGAAAAGVPPGTTILPPSQPMVQPLASTKIETQVHIILYFKVNKQINN